MNDLANGTGGIAWTDAGDRFRASAPGRHHHVRRRRNDRTVAALVASQLQSGSQEDETNGAMAFGTAGCVPVRLRPAERRTAVVEYRHATVCACRSALPGDLESLEFVTHSTGSRRDRAIEVAVTASRCQLRRRSGRFPGGIPPSRATDSSWASTGVVTAVGPRCHRASDPVITSAACPPMAAGHIRQMRCPAGGDAPPARAAGGRRRPAVPTASATARCLHDLAHLLGRQGADSLEDRWCRAGGVAIARSRRMRDLRHPRAVPSGDNCCDMNSACLRLTEHRVRRGRSGRHRWVWK